MSNAIHCLQFGQTKKREPLPDTRPASEHQTIILLAQDVYRRVRMPVLPLTKALKDLRTRYDLPEAGPSRRPQADYAALPLLNQPFLLNDALARTYKAQYSNIYFQRLLQLKAIVAKAAKQRWAHVQGERGSKRDGP